MSTSSRLILMCVAVALILLTGTRTAAQAQGIVVPPAPQQLPRHASFVLHPGESWTELSLLSGAARSKLSGSVRLFLGDPEVAVIALPGLVGLSVDAADLVALDFEPDLPGVAEPLRLVQSPGVKSLGSYNRYSGAISFELSLISSNTSQAPVPMPLHLSGTLLGGMLTVDGNNGNVADAAMRVHISAYEVPLPPPTIDLWFSTNTGFHASQISPASTTVVSISDGDLLSVRGHIVRRNRELTGRLGIMPMVPDLGLDAAIPAPKGEIWFSFKKQDTRYWSESLATYLTHGDLLSDRGYVVRTNSQLLGKFMAMPSASNVGLDAIACGPNRSLLFSTDDGFFCQNLNAWIGHGDLLSEVGRVVRTNAQLLANFHINDMLMRPTPADYGLDAIIVRPNGEYWFSTQIGFVDLNFGPVSDGDLLSTNGYIVARNRDLVAAFAPVENLGSFGLDAATLAVPWQAADFDGDGDVDAADLATFNAAVAGPAVESPNPEIGDMDSDGDSDQSDFGILQLCLSGSAVPAQLECAEYTGQ